MKELFDGEYAIPEGYTASIENGKIIVKKEESEDERIRKIISDILLIDRDEIREILDVNNILMQDIDAWLEEQNTDISSFPKEQQVFMRKYVSLDKITLIKLLAERDANNAEIIESFEKQGEQNKWKPSKDEMDALYGLAYMTNKMDDKKDEAITKLYQDLKREFFDGASYENMFPSSPVDALIKDEKEGEQKSDWSEEDENGLNDALLAIKQATSIAKDETDMGNLLYAEKWLKSLKDRVHPQWKPSEEELNALDIAKDRNDKTGWHLCKLYKQLKKL